MRPLELLQEQTHGDYLVSSDPEKLDLSFIHEWLAHESYWCKDIPLKILERAIKNSFCVGVYHRSGEQVGFGRVITDYTTFAWITDVFIVETHRGKGLSVFLMECILQHPEMRVVRRWLLGTDLAHGLYRKLGFSDLDHPENFLTLHHSQMYSSGEFAELLSGFMRDL